MSKKRYPFIFISFFMTIVLAISICHCSLSDENERFETYINALFCEELRSNSLSLAYTLKDPKAYNIRNTKITLGSINSDVAAACAITENSLAQLTLFSPYKLSDENRLIYDLLKDSFTTAHNLAPFTLYEEPLSPLTGTQAQLPILLSEYPINSTDDIETYFALLKDFPNYFTSLVEFEKAKSKQGLFMSAIRADAVIEECISFINMKEKHYLHTTFRSRISKLELSKEQKNAYILQNKKMLDSYVFPAYKMLADQLEKLRNTGKNETGLCYFKNGKSYYEYLVLRNTGSSKTVPELQNLTQQQVIKDISDLQKVSNIEVSNKVILFPDSNPANLLFTLKDKIGDAFPQPPDVQIDIKYVDRSMQKYLSPAFYLIPPIDHISENFIYINPAHMSNELSLFTTLAHEGYPGHLYQTTYFSNLNPAPVRSLLSYGGYTEGWATYCEMLSYYLSPLENEEATIFQKNASAMLGIYALADMGIHYDGWSFAETLRFFREYGINDRNGILEIYNLILGDPGNYLKYYIGYLEFLELKKDAIQMWGDNFSQKRFHKEILETGPAPFWILRKKMQLGTETF